MNIKLTKQTTEALRWIIDILNHHKVDYQISGGLAGKIFGSERELHDIDIDISEKDFDLIVPDTSEYITYGPKRYRDGKWDLELITLNYKGQEIDICGSDTLLISNKERTKWISCPADFSKSIKLTVNGIVIKVINPKDLIEDKIKLDGEHHLEDIEATKQYMVKGGESKPI